MNASKTIEVDMPELYAKIRPEIKFAHEVYFMNEPAEVQKYALTEFCPREKLSPDQLKERLQVLDASLAAVQGIDYADLRVYIETLINCVNTNEENTTTLKWYFDLIGAESSNSYGFETYEPDEVPMMVRDEQRFRDTGRWVLFLSLISFISFIFTDTPDPMGSGY